VRVFSLEITQFCKSRKRIVARLETMKATLLLTVLASVLFMSGCVPAKSTTGGPTPTPTPTPQPSAHSVDVMWDQSPSGNLQGYRVYRSQVSGGPYSPISGMLTTSTSQFADQTVVSGQKYFYVVTSVDVNGLESVASSEVSITVPTS
jgi:fibronectin type 3 domain-containing protein